MRHHNAIRVGLTVGALLGYASAVPVAAAARPFSDQIVTTLSVTAQSEVQNAGGTVTDKWTVAGSAISVTGPAHMKVTAELRTVDGQHRLLLGATPPPESKSSVDLAAASYPQPYRSWCLTYYPNNDGEIYACDDQQMLYESGANWYLSDHLTESGHYGNGIFDKSLRSETVYVTWTANNSIVEWSPISTDIPVGNCSTAQVGVDYYVNLSYSWQVCPTNWGLSVLNSTNFGVIWWGQSQSWEGVQGVDAVHSPPNATASATMHVSWLAV
jgi:hypothetical protein